MSGPRVPGEGLYRLLLRLHPGEFRDRYEAELLRCFRDTWRDEAAGRGWGTTARFWARTVAGTFVIVWRQRRDRSRTGSAGGEAMRVPDRRSRGTETMSGLAQDLRVGARALLRRPGWSAVVVLTLGLGMGATIAVASIFHAVLVAPLPWGDDDRLVRLYLRNVEAGSERLRLSAPAAEELRELASSLESVAILEDLDSPGVDITGGDRPERIRDLRVSHKYFDALGTAPVAGRVFEPHEETRDTRVAVVTASIADRFLGGVETAPGQSVILDQIPYSVIGVVPSGLHDPLAGSVDVWLPAALADTDNTWDNNYLDGFARLAPGVTLEEARAELEVVARRHAELGSAAAEKEFMVMPLRDELVGSARPLLIALLGAVVFLLLLTCSNVASLLLARAATRERELAIRTTLGSSRVRLVRHFSVETCIVALAGGLCGLVVGRLGVDMLLAVAPADLPLQQTVGLGREIALLAGGLAAAVGLGLGIATSLPYSRPRIAPTLAESGRSGQGGRTARRTRTVLVVAEVTLAVVLLVGAGILLRTVQALQSRDLGIDPDGVVLFDTHLPEVRYPSAELRIDFQRRLRDRLEAIPGVEAAGATSHLPLTGPANTWGTRRALAVGEPVHEDPLSANQRIVSGDYFETVGVRLVRGRLLDEGDGPGAPRVVVVSETLARTLYGEEDPVGEVLRVGPVYPTIVGVVADVALTARMTPGPMVFHSYPQFGATRRWPMTQVLSIREGTTPPWDAVRAELAEVDPELVLHAPRPLDQVVRAGIDDERFAALLLQSFAGLALILASLGIYGVLSHSVERRRHEIGVRMALGADAGAVRRMVMGRGLLLMTVGTALGLVAALGLARVLDFLVFGVSTTDRVVFVGVPALLLAVALFASYLPARLATRVEPASSLEAT